VFSNGLPAVYYDSRNLDVYHTRLARDDQAKLVSFFVLSATPHYDQLSDLLLCCIFCSRSFDSCHIYRVVVGDNPVVSN